MSIRKAKKAVVYDGYLNILGGGERSALTYAKALSVLGYETEVVTTGALPSEERFQRAFDGEFDEFKLRSIPLEKFASEMKEISPEVFLNYTLNNFVENPGKVGIYGQMFPCVRLDARHRPKDLERLKSYQVMVSNSTFTKLYTDFKWDYPEERSEVINPSMADRGTLRAEQFLKELPKKEKTIVAVGRFNPYPNNKNQKIIIEAFLEACRRDPALGDWKLALVGNRNDDPNSVAYFEECQELAREAGLAVTIYPDLALQDLEDLLERSFGYVHAAGAFHPPNEEPYRCEHFGRSIAEAMAHGCIPLLFARAGVFDILDVSKAGIPYMTFEGFVEGFGELAELWSGDQVAAMQRNLITSALDLRFEKFTERVEKLIEKYLV